MFGVTFMDQNVDDYLIDPRMIPNVRNIRQVSCGNYHTAFIDHEGSVWTFGYNASGQLGLGEGYRDYVEFPTKIVGDIKAKQVSCGRGHTAVLDINGYIWMFGGGNFGLKKPYNKFIPNKLENFADVKQVSCGSNITLFIDSEDFAWLMSGTLKNPEKIHYIKGVKQISCGDNHAGIVDKSGRLWTFGNNKHGQLGSTQTIFAVPWYEPKLVAIKNVVQVSCGDRHTAAIDSSGQVWTFGEGVNGELGLSQYEVTTLPDKVTTLKNIVQVSCGGKQTMFLDSDGKVWIAGLGTIEPTPTLLEGFEKVTQISCGRGAEPKSAFIAENLMF